MLETKKKACRNCDGSGEIYNGDEYDVCRKCDGKGYIKEVIGEDEIVFVNVYEITRHFGGYEEGGWYFNWYQCIESVPVRNKNSELMQEEMENRYEDRKHGNIYSVLGGTDIDVRIEFNPKQSETRERPHYE